MISDQSLTTSPPLQTSRVTSSSNQHSPNPLGSGVPDNAAARGAQSSNHPSPIDVDDIVIAVMGITRVGKSSFINEAAGRMEIAITDDLESQTQAVQHVRCVHPDGRRNVVLVDTPGSNNTCLSDDEILKTIADWLKETYQNSIKLSGLLYFHRITDVRMAGASVRDLAIFKDLCGKNNLKNVVFVTTMWDEVEESTGSKREEELLSDFWNLGSRACRFRRTLESAWEIIDCLDLERSNRRRTPLEIQREMVDRGLQLDETTAAKTLLSLNNPAGEGKTSTTSNAGRSGVDFSPGLTSTSALVPASHPTSPPNHPGSSAPDNLAVRGAQSSSSIDSDDIVIAVMGITRAGKSSFIKKATGRTEDVVGKDLLESQTRVVQHVRCFNPDGRRNVVLVDTPGFDNTYLSDAEILKMLADWLKETYRNKIKLSGLLYLHRITDVRMVGASSQYLSAFKKLCGKNNLKNVVLVTTMWDEVEESVGSKREEELLSVFWKDMLRLGSRARRFQGTFESAWEIIDCLDMERSSLLLRFLTTAKKLWTKLRTGVVGRPAQESIQ